MAVSKLAQLGTDSAALKARALAVARELGAETDSLNRVVMLAQLRSFGFYFSPVNFFFLYRGDCAKYLLAEVSNTPWNQRHCYLVDLEVPEPSEKTFHVSPFMSLDMQYRWQVQAPAASTAVAIESWKQQRIFKAVFSGRHHALNGRNAFRVRRHWPIVGVAMLMAIYWQALKLFLKGITYVPYQRGKAE